MNKSILVVLLSLLFVINTNTATAGEDLDTSVHRFGVGTSFGSDNIIAYGGDGSPLMAMMLPYSFTNFYFPMLLSGKIKVEPEIGFFRQSRSYGDNSYSSSSSFNSFRFGMGIFYAPVVGRTVFYIGIRGGFNMYIMASESDGESSDDSETDFFIGPAAGAEYFLSDHFSLGAEMQFNYISPADWSSGYGSGDESEYYLSTRSHVFARFYFGTTKVKGRKAKGRIDKPGPKETSEPVKKAAPAAPEESPAEIRHVEPPAEESVKKPAKDEKPPPAERPAIAPPAAKVPPCPEGAEPSGDAPPKGWEQYCAKKDDKGNPVKHGWFKSWYENSQVASEGDYREGLKQGAWIFYYDDGQKRLEAEYKDDQKHGNWVFWERTGAKQKEEKYEAGRAVE